MILRNLKLLICLLILSQSTLAQAKCFRTVATEITLKNTQATSNVPMLARLALPSTQSARIVNDQIKLAGGGWGGTFIGH